MYIKKAALVSPFLDFITTIGENEDEAIREIEGWINVIQEKAVEKKLLRRAHNALQMAHKSLSAMSHSRIHCVDMALPEIQEEFIIDLVQPFTVSQLKQIANMIFISGYGSECSRTYISVRRDALDECLSILEMEKLSIEDVLKSEFQSSKSKLLNFGKAKSVGLHEPEKLSPILDMYMALVDLLPDIDSLYSTEDSS
ncbi:hypothetical protein Peur_064119 [Populus x canadensis]